MTNEPLRAEDFRTALLASLAEAERQGFRAVDIKSGDLHRELGDYPGTNHRMPLCCDVMRDEMKAGDQVVSAPPKGKGATLTIRYQLPRPR